MKRHLYRDRLDRRGHFRWLTGIAMAAVLCVGAALGQDEAWRLRVIDDGSRGADGVRLADVDRDGRLDIATGWEEGGVIRVSFHPGGAAVRQQWPAIEVGRVASPEDAFFFDVDGDGWLDVISCCEGKQQTIFWHRNPGGDAASPNAGRAASRDPRAWRTQVVTGSEMQTRWMFGEPIAAREVVFGAKDPHARICVWNADGIDEPAPLPRLRPAGWIMSLRRFDVDGDGDVDVVYSDRKGPLRGVGWLEQRPGQAERWRDHSLGGAGLEVMFLDIRRFGGQPRVACNTRAGYVLLLAPGQDIAAPWRAEQVPHPPGVGGGKGVAWGDMNQDGRVDLVCTCEEAQGKVGVFWMEAAEDEAANRSSGWTFHDISGSRRGVKYDRIELLDLDDDGDLDVLTCEERDNLGVIWYENPR